MLEGDDLESEIDDKELENLNLKHIVDAYRKQDYDTIPMEHITKVHKVYKDAQVGKVARTQRK